MIEFSHPSPADTAHLVALWNSCLEGFPLTEQLLRQTIEGDPYYENDGCWIARTSSASFEAGEIVGWVLTKSMRSAGPEVGRFQNRGGIGALCVHPSWQRRGIGTQLMERAENWLQDNNSPQTLLYFPHHLLPGVPHQCVAARAFLEKRGYSGWRETFDLRRDLKNYRVPPQVLATLQSNLNVEVRALRESEAHDLIEFVAHEFPGAWEFSTRGHFTRGGAPHDFIVAVEDGAIIGFCHTADFRSPWLLPSTYWHQELGTNYGGLGPIGMGAAQRKRGLGLTLCALSVNDLKERGVERMAIDWTSLVEFYGKLGFEVWKRYLQAERAIG